MRKRWLWSGLLAAVLALAGVAYALKNGDTLFVRTTSAKLMAQPKFIGASAGSVSRGDKLTYQDAKGDWYKVTGKAGSGWIHKSNVQVVNVKLSSASGGGSGGASQEEVELAGRGFTPEVEKDYRGKHPNLDFGHVHAIEKTSIDSDAVSAFATEGQLGGSL